MPLLTKSEGASKEEREFLRPNQVDFVNFNEKEEATCITSLSLLQFSCAKAYLLVPILSLLTVFVLPVMLYWKAHLRAKYLYWSVTSEGVATHLLVCGRDGNVEIVPLQNMNSRVSHLLP